MFAKLIVKKALPAVQFPIKWEYDTIAFRMAASKKELCTKTKKIPLSEQHHQHPEFEVKNRQFGVISV